MENREGRSLTTNKPLVCFKVTVKETRRNTSGIPYLITDRGLFRLNLTIPLESVKIDCEYFIQTVYQNHKIIPIEVVDFIQTNS